MTTDARGGVLIEEIYHLGCPVRHGRQLVAQDRRDKRRHQRGAPQGADKRWADAAAPTVKDLPVMVLALDVPSVAFKSSSFGKSKWLPAGELPIYVQQVFKVTR